MKCYISQRILKTGKTSWVAFIPELKITLRGVELRKRQDNKRRAWTFDPGKRI